MDTLGFAVDKRYADLGGAIRGQIRQCACFSDLKEPPRQSIGQRYGQRHQVGRMGAGVPKYRRLVGYRDLVDFILLQGADIGFPHTFDLLDQAGHYGTVGGIEILWPVADFLQRVPCGFWNVDHRIAGVTDG